MTHTPTIVLLGGSGLGPWAWGRVTPQLQAFGFQVRTPQLTAVGTDGTPAKNVSLEQWIDDTVSELRDMDPDGTVLVAHSFAGYIAAAVLEREPRLARTTIFLDAVIPTPGRSWFDDAGAQTEAFMTSIAEEGAIPFFTLEQLDQIYPGHGISDDDWSWISSHVSPQPTHTYAQPPITREIDTGTARLAYVRCLHTSPPVASIDEATPGWWFGTLPTGHWPMITDPLSTAKIIDEIASR